MSPPEPMLSASARRWPAGGEWVLQPKWDGFRLLVAIGPSRQVRAWSRNGTSLTERLGSLIDCFADVSAGTVFDGELVVVGERDGQPAQDFSAVTRAVFTGNPAASKRLHYVGFDLLHLTGRDLRARPWRERDERLRQALPVGERVRMISTEAATPAAHAAIVCLGFEGTVLKRPGSAYRAGRNAAWVKHKARCVAEGTLLTMAQDRHGHWQAICDVDGRRVRASAGVHARALAGQTVSLTYSRVDADGSLREARLTTARLV